MAYGQIGKKVELAVQLSAWVEPEGRALKGLEVVLSTRAARSS
jgi:hypothetical protein